MEVDGSARLDQFTRAGQRTWTGTVTAKAREEFWRALEQARFPGFPSHRIPAGSSIRDLNVGGPAGKSVYIAYHEAPRLAGYAVAFRLLDTVIRQLSQDTVKVVPDGAAVVVENVESADRPQ